jgi:hypothetical protein
MAFVDLVLERGDEVQSAPLGFSWTTFFFSFFVPIFRGDWVWFFVQFILACLTSGLSVFVFAFIYNKIYAKSLLDKGFTVSPGQLTQSQEIRVKNYLGRKVI